MCVCEEVERLVVVQRNYKSRIFLKAIIFVKNPDIGTNTELRRKKFNCGFENCRKTVEERN